MRTRVESTTAAGTPGQILCVEKENGILVQCKEGSLWISELHPAGKRPMPAYDYAMGHALKAGEKVFD